MNHVDRKMLQKLFQAILDRLLVCDALPMSGDHYANTSQPYSVKRAEAYYTALHILENTDFTEVVRCKDCRHFEICPNSFLWCNKHVRETREQDYCSHGERKENNND